MKTRIFVIGLVFSILAAGPARGQPSYLGFEGGVNFAYLNGQDVNPVFGSRFGAVAGALAHFSLIHSLAVQPELLYIQKGAQAPNGVTSFQLNYIEVPVLAEISTGLPLLNPGILLGPSLSANVLMSGLSNVNPLDVGLIGGLQFHLEPILVSGRYELGLTNVTSDRNMQNGNFTFLVGVAFI
jgi:hypothetical protein